MSRPFDIAVIGSGPGGYRAAVLGALRGLRVAVVEKGDWGGCCLNRGCVPKKDWYTAPGYLLLHGLLRVVESRRILKLI